MEDRLYHYRAEVVRVYDGDTIRVNLDLGFGMWMMDQSVRLRGINTPELRGEQRPDGIISRDALIGRLQGKKIIISTEKDKSDKYGRWLGVIYLEGENINQWLVTEGYAKPYMV
jgi:micrococcal nuclease